MPFSSQLDEAECWACTKTPDGGDKAINDRTTHHTMAFIATVVRLLLVLAARIAGNAIEPAVTCIVTAALTASSTPTVGHRFSVNPMYATHLT